VAPKGRVESKTRPGIRELPPVRWNLLDSEVLSWRYSTMQPVQFFAELFEIREMIEPDAGALAAIRARPADTGAGGPARCAWCGAVSALPSRHPGRRPQPAAFADGQSDQRRSADQPSLF